MNLVIPLASHSKFFSLEEYGYPKPLVEVAGKPMIERVIENLAAHNHFNQIIFIIKQEDCDTFHLDDTLLLLSALPITIIRLQSDTAGALCSVLLAIESINDNEPLLIANADQIFDGGINKYVRAFQDCECDAACVTFQSVHPRWSYVRTNQAGEVIEAAEKRPISKNAIAGLYFYKTGAEFIKFAMASIKYSLGLNGLYFIAPVFNQYILSGKKVVHFPAEDGTFHTFYSPQKIEEYELSFGMKAKR